MKLNLLATIKKTARFFKRIGLFLTVYPIDHLLSSQREKKHKIKVFLSDYHKTKNPNLCIFVHFDKNNELDKNCIHYLSELKNAECDIILVSTSADLTPAALEVAKKYCRCVIVRSNIGRDFYSYRVGIEYAKSFLGEYQKLILANDSVYGPFFPLNKLIGFGDNASLDFWGVTDSNQIIYHIQSYFFVFTKKMFSSDFFKQYWSDVKLINHKRHIIEKYELKITQFFVKKGFHPGVYCHYEDVINQMPEMTSVEINRKKMLKRKKCNITHDAWDYLIINHQDPFLKKELVLRNPTKIKNTNFQEVLNKHAKIGV